MTAIEIAIFVVGTIGIVLAAFSMIGFVALMILLWPRE